MRVLRELNCNNIKVPANETQLATTITLPAEKKEESETAEKKEESEAAEKKEESVKASEAEPKNE